MTTTAIVSREIEILKRDLEASRRELAERIAEGSGRRTAELRGALDSVKSQLRSDWFIGSADGEEIELVTVTADELRLIVQAIEERERVLAMYFAWLAPARIGLVGKTEDVLQESEKSP